MVRQRSHTPRIAGSNPASATIFNTIAREGVSKPASFGVRRHPGQHRGARPFYLTSSIGVSASTVAFHVTEAGAAPAWSANFQLPKCKSLHAALRRRKFKVQVLAGAPSIPCWPCCKSSIPPCEGGGAGASPVGQPNSPVAQAVRASDFDSEGDGAIPSGASNFINPV